MRSLVRVLLFSVLVLGAVSSSETAKKKHKPKNPCDDPRICKCISVEDNYNIECAHRKLKEIPENLPKTVYRLNLSFNRLQNFTSDVLNETSNLLILDVSHNSLTNIEEGSFNNTNRLMQLNLSHNHLTSIPPYLFSQVKQLEMLDLSHNMLTEIPNTLFGNLHNVLTLDLSYNRLTSIEDGSFKFTLKLKQLYLNHNKLTKLPENLLNSSYSVKLKCSYNDISELPRTISASPFSKNLDELSLSKNRLTTINQTSFGKALSIVNLVLSRNRLTELVPNVFSKVRLSYALDLSRNEIKIISADAFGQIVPHQLKILLLHRNHLKVIYKETFHLLTHLVYLCLFNNKLVRLENNAFEGLGNVNIFLFGNKFRNLTESPFPCSVSEIYLHDNKINNISQTVFENVERAKIFLNCEPLEALPRYGHHVDIQCSNQYVPPIKMDLCNTKSLKKGDIQPVILQTAENTDVIEILKKEGFTCSRNVCTPCKKGTYGDGKHGCINCPAGGFFQDDIGVTARYPSEQACQRCNNGTWVKEAGTGVSIDKCEVCPEGTNQNRPASYRACFCKVNHTRTHRFGKCLPCDNNIYNCSHDVKLPLPGYFWSWDFANASSSNYSNFVENIKTLNHSFKESSNYYSGVIPKAFPCLRKESCINNGLLDVNTSCDEGYQGWLCAKCQNGFYRALNLCVPCPKKVLLIVTTFVFVCLAVSLLLLLSWQFDRERKHPNKKRSVINVMISRTKILLGFYQIVGKLLESLHDVTWADPLVPLGAVISLMELNIIRDVSGAACLVENLEFSPERRFVIGIIMPIFIICSASLIYQAKQAYLKYKYLPSETQLLSTKLKKLKDRLFTYVTVLFFCMYPGISTVIFNMYPSACQEFPLHDKATENETRRLLRSDYGIDCKTSAFHSYNIAAYCFTLLYIIAFPATLFCFLWKHCSRWSTRPTDDNNFKGENSTSEEDMPLVVDYSDVPPVIPTWLNFLCENYKSQFWFWEILELIRKCTQTILLTIYGWDDRTVPLTICVSVLFLTLHARYMPMKCPYDQRLQLFSLAAIFINVVIASAKADIRGTKHPTAIFIIVLNIAVLFLIAGEVLLRTIVYIKKRFPKKVVLFFSAGWHYLFDRQSRNGERIV
ncbi:uncharacterized protein [Apostichopus japonicus]|uniref:uncharacterized protein isoform X2 n=1 Tax=Stichopus japonicus TaxID=307972 RepID=UPI003AB72B8B